MQRVWKVGLFTVVIACNAGESSEASDPGRVPTQLSADRRHEMGNSPPSTITAAPAIQSQSGKVEQSVAPTVEQSGPPLTPDFIDTDGSRYIWIRTLPDAGPPRSTPIEPPNDAGNGDGSGGGRGLRSRSKRIEDMTIDELAAKMRPRLFMNGEEYLLDHAPVEMAEKVKANHCPTTEGYNPGYPVDVSTSSDLVAPEYVIPADTRQSYDHAAVSWPAMTNLFTQTSLGFCTSTIIGKQVAASAAHCFSNGSAVSTSNTFTPYASNTAPTAPYGSYTVANTSIMIPSGWNGTDWQWDYARVRFPTNTWANWGWVSTGFIGYGASGTAVMTWGYPNDKSVPQLWLGTGNIGANGWSSGNYLCATRQTLRNTTDITPGNSGGGLLTQPGSMLIGINSSQRWRGASEANSIKINEARQWDSVTNAFFTQTGVWP